MIYTVYLNGKPGTHPDGTESVGLSLDEAKVACMDLVLALVSGDLYHGITTYAYNVNTNVSFLVSHHGGVDTIDMMEQS